MFSYNPNKTLDEQGVSQTAKTIIAILIRDYWATEAQREKILAKEQYDRKKLEEEKKASYSYDNLFKNHAQKQEVEETSMIEYKETIWQKIMHKIKSMFHHN